MTEILSCLDWPSYLSAPLDLTRACDQICTFPYQCVAQEVQHFLGGERRSAPSTRHQQFRHPSDNKWACALTFVCTWRPASEVRCSLALIIGYNYSNVRNAHMSMKLLLTKRPNPKEPKLPAYIHNPSPNLVGGSEPELHIICQH